jgi:glutathione peroxidase
LKKNFSTMNDLYSIEVKTISGDKLLLSEYSGKVLLIVNTASKCGFTPQYKGLQDLFMNYKEKGLVILGFPCNQFGRQEPGNSLEITEFCTVNYNITFPLFDKIDVNGPNTHSLFKLLKNKARGFMGTERILWNFTKFLVSQEGRVLKRFSPFTTPEEIRPYIDKIITG